MAEETLTEAPKPAAKSPPPKTGISSGKRVVIGLNVIVQVLVVVIIVALVNFISFRRFVRWDISRDQKFALAPQTKWARTRFARGAPRHSGCAAIAGLSLFPAFLRRPTSFDGREA